MPFNRSQILYGNIQRILQLKNISADKVLDDEIYSALTEAQIQIFARVNFERKYDLSLVVGTGEYLLSSQVNADDRIYIRDIKEFIYPSTWRYKLDFIPNVDWGREARGTLTVTQPVKATLFNNSLFLFPVPTVAETLTIWAWLRVPETDISITVEPELNMEWNEALKDYAIFSLTGDTEFMKLFLEQISILKNSTYTTGGQLQKPMV